MDKTSQDTTAETRVGREIFRILLFAPGRSRSVNYLSNYLSEPRAAVADHCAQLQTLGLAEYDAHRQICTLVGDHVSRARKIQDFL